MAFEPAQIRTPTSIGAIIVILKDKPATSDEPEIKSVHYRVEVLDQNGVRMDMSHDTGNLTPHLTAAQIQGLLNFMASLREKAANEFIP